MTQPAKGQDQTMEEILSSIRRIISDEPARFPAAEPRTETVRNDRRSTDSRRDDFLRDDDLRGELRARLLRQEGGTRPETRVEDRPLKPAPEEPAQDFPPMQSRPQPSALTLDGIPSALEVCPQEDFEPRREWAKTAVTRWRTGWKNRERHSESRSQARARAVMPSRSPR